MDLNGIETVPWARGVSSGLASLIERAVGLWGLPNGYVLGEEAGR
jgi:hypothetical protein